MNDRASSCVIQPAAKPSSPYCSSWNQSGWSASPTEKGPITSTPYKVYALLAPAEGVSPAALAAATIPVRLPRFLLTALAFALIGRVLEGRIDRRWVLSGFTGGWLIFYAWFWASHPG